MRTALSPEDWLQLAEDGVEIIRYKVLPWINAALENSPCTLPPVGRAKAKAFARIVMQWLCGHLMRVGAPCMTPWQVAFMKYFLYNSKAQET